MIVASGSDIDRLIDEGLQLYGKGEVDAALLAWERVLAVEPDNAQASSYVDYVRQNYELLTSSEPVVEDGSTAPFGIEEEPEYQIEILPGELPESVAPMHMDLDEGWFLDEAPTREASFIRGEAPLPNTTLELEADEPPMPDDVPEVSFEDATREYHGPAAEFGVGQDSTSGFSQDTTGIKKRDMGFVQPVAEPMVNVKLRTPETPLTPGRTRSGERAPRIDEDDLIASLPSPRPADGTAPTRELPLPANPRGSTREMPEPARSPAHTRETLDMPSPGRPKTTRDISAVSQAEVMFSHTKTEDLEAARGSQITDPMVHAPTRELGLRNAVSPEPPPPIRPATQPGPTEGTRHDIVLPFDPIDARTAQILDEVDENAPPEEAKEDRTRRRITTLFDKAIEWNAAGELDRAVAAVDLALSEDPNSALAQKLIHRNRETTQNVFQNFLGDLSRTPQLSRPLHELASAPISPRAAFLLSRIDGMISIDEILDVSGMPRLEAYRHLCQLYLRGILR